MTKYTIRKTDINKALKQADIICKRNGLKLTKLRQDVLSLILKEGGYVKAYDLLDELKKIDPSAKPPTIYRTLDFLLEHGFIHKLQSLNAFIGCSHPQDHKECYFLICNNCQKIKECCSKKINNVIKNTTSENNFVPNQAVLEIAGTCQQCLN